MIFAIPGKTETQETFGKHINIAMKNKLFSTFPKTVYTDFRLSDFTLLKSGDQLILATSSTKRFGP